MAKIEQSVEIHGPVRNVYQQMTQFDEYPLFMDGVREVRQLDEAHLHWRGEKGGKEIEWDSEITERVQDKVIAWRSTSGPKNTGRVSFQSAANDVTRVTVSMESDDVATGDAGKAARQRLDSDLQRFKEMVESQPAGSAVARGAGQEGQSGSSNGASNRRSGAVGAGADKSGKGPATAGSNQVRQFSTHVEGNMAEQSGSMQFSGETSQSRSHSPAALGDVWAQPARMMSQMSHSMGQMPVRMLEQEASMLQKSFVSPQAWLPNVLNAWEEPFVMMRKMSEEMDQFFGKLLQRPIGKIAQSRSSTGIVARNWTPTVEITQRGDEMVICADLPGLTKDDVELQVHEDRLTISGERREEFSAQDSEGYHRTERSYGRFYRAIPLPQGVDGHNAEAKMRDGVLEITVPLQSQQTQGVRLDIREAEEGELREQREQINARQRREQLEHAHGQQAPEAKQQRVQPGQPSKAPDDRSRQVAGSASVRSETQA